jgi:hypothetical protein
MIDMSRRDSTPICSFAVKEEWGDTTVNTFQSRVGAGDIWRKGSKSQIKIFLVVPVAIFENANLVALML